MEEKSPYEMKSIYVFDRVSKQNFQERVFGQKILGFLYGEGFWARILGSSLREIVARIPLISFLVGLWQKLPWTKRKIIPFIQTFQMDASEYIKSPEEFSSFNDFFIRKLRSDARPIANGDRTAIIPADGRFRFYSDLQKVPEFTVKGEKLSLQTLLNDDEIARDFEGGSAVFGRLCPVDYHRVHFPFDCVPSKTKVINGWLYSVNPVALEWNRSIFMQNKRVLTELQSDVFGKVLFIEVGATCVGSIHQTFELGVNQKKGDEKGYFSFGASALILLFQKEAISFDKDLLQSELEVRCLLGQSMGRG